MGIMSGGMPISGAGDVGGPSNKPPSGPGASLLDFSDPGLWLALAGMTGGLSSLFGGPGGASGAASGTGGGFDTAGDAWAAGGGAGAAGGTGGVSSALTSGEFDPNYLYGGAGGAGSASSLGGFLGSPAGKILLGLLTTGGSAALAHGLIGNAAKGNVPPQLSSLLDSAVQRQQYQNPLFQAKTQGQYAMLPSFARQGTSLTGSLPGPAGPAYNPTGGMQSLFPTGGG